ncbi:MAG: S9 family peptidase [Chloroflexi bacterium]|nr:S9 family peptidase [Chloroflexota bacterium]
MTETRRRKIIAEDIFRVRWIDDPQLSPDGQCVAFVVSGLDRQSDASTSQIYIMALDGSHPILITPLDARESNPRWSPDSRHLALISDRSGAPQLWSVAFAGGARPGAATQLTSTPYGVSNPCWSPDGCHIVFVAAIDDLPGWLQKPAAPYPLITSLKYKADGIGILPTRRKHLWIVPVSADQAPADNQPIQITFGDGDDTMPAWSPDGAHIAFLANRTPRRDYNQVMDIWLVSPTGYAPRLLTASLGAIRTLSWSPNGATLAYIGHERGDTQGVNFSLWVVQLDGTPSRNLTRHLDRSVGLVVRSDDLRGMQPPSPAWTADGAYIYFAFAEGSSSHIARTTLDGTIVTIISGERACLAFSLQSAVIGGALSGRLVSVIADDLQPGEIYLADLTGAGERPVTAFNAAWLAELMLSRPERLLIQADDGNEVEAFLLRPPDYVLSTLSPGQHYPLVVQVHGGPHYALGHRFYFEFQRLAAQGYMILTPNIRGSQGYGEAFATAIHGDWGGRDYQDLMQVVDMAVTIDGVDAARLAITGVSYGGFMTNWAIGHSHRFRAAICENGISNLLSNFGTGGGGQAFWTSSMRGTPYTMPERYRLQSPITYVENMITPLLLIHAEQDHNCDIGQSEELFVALKLLAEPGTARDVAFVRIPAEGHLMNLVGRPSMRLGRIAIIDQWLKDKL